MKKITILLLLFPSWLMSQSCPEGYNSFQAKEFKLAYKSYSDCVKANPKDSSLVFMKGYSLVMLKQYDKAIPVLSEAVKLNVQPINNAKFVLALSYAAINDEENALTTLESAVKTGFPSFKRLDSTEFVSIRDTVRFNKIRKDVYKNAFPCLKDQNNNKFDFWLGEWDVYTNGNFIAVSKITKAKGGCAVHEDYVVNSGAYVGQSINFYDPTDKKWNQYWVGSSGDKSKYIETDNYDASLQFLAKSKGSNGIENWTRMTFIAKSKDEVHQNFESSNDNGASWTLGFQGVYKRK